MGPSSQREENARSSLVFIFSHYLVFHNKPRSHYQLIYAISPPQHCQLNKAKGFLRSCLTDLSLICTTAPQSPMAGANKPPTTRPAKCTDYQGIVVRAQHGVCCVGGWRSNRTSQIKARVADGSWMWQPWGWRYNGGEGTQVTPAEWKAVTWIASLSLKSTPAYQMTLNTDYFTVLNYAPAATTHLCSHTHTQTINLY